MYYVVRQGDALAMYHAAYERLEDAMGYAEQLKNLFGRQYKIVKAEPVWTTQTLKDIKDEGALK